MHLSDLHDATECARAATASLHRCESPKHIWMLQGTRGSQIPGEGARRGCSQPWAGPGRWTADAVHEPSFLPLLHSLGLLLRQPQAHPAKDTGRQHSLLFFVLLQWLSTLGYLFANVQRHILLSPPRGSWGASATST